jgi:putative hydrolase of the HAD superfamily
MSTQRTLLIDADDTLWENNIYFEQVSGEYFAQLAAHGIDRTRAEQMLWEREQRNVKVTGYGSKAFCQSLHQVAADLGCADLEPWILDRENWICHHSIEFMTGVQETLPVLHAKNQLIVVTKGREDEQLGKLNRSGLHKFFHATEVVFEKDVRTYRDLVAKYRLKEAWMIGNSPRSDINPAKAAGLGTVFIPYHTTWQHELEEISPDGAETLVLDSFAQLLEHFGR